MTVADILDRAAERLSKPGAWTQGTIARDAKGRSTFEAEADKAVSWCAVGAVLFEADTPLEGDDACEFFRKQVTGGGGLGQWNDADDQTQERVVTAFRKAAAKAREQGK